MFKIEFWVKNVRAIFSGGGPGGGVRPPVGIRGRSTPQKNLIMGYRDGSFRQS